MPNVIKVITHQHEHVMVVDHLDCLALSRVCLILYEAGPNNNQPQGDDVRQLNCQMFDNLLVGRAVLFTVELQ